MAIQRFETGSRLSKIVIHGDTVYLAGLTADKTAGQSVGAQTQEILAAIDGTAREGRHRQIEARAGDDLAAGHPHRRRDEQGVGRLDAARLRAGARLHRGAAAIAGEDGGDPGDGGEVTRRNISAAAVTNPSDRP